MVSVLALNPADPGSILRRSEMLWVEPQMTVVGIVLCTLQADMHLLAKKLQFICLKMGRNP